MVYPLSSFSQDYYNSQFSDYIEEDGNIIKSFVDIKIDSNRIQIEYYTQNYNNPKLLKSITFGITTTSIIENTEDVKILVSGRSFILRHKDEKDSEIEMIYYGRIIKHFKNHTQFEIIKPIIKIPENPKPIFEIQNPQFDFVLLNEQTRISFSYHGISLDRLELRSANSEIDSKYGSAIISKPKDSICNLQLYIRDNDSLLYQKSLVVINENRPINVANTLNDSIWYGGNISRNSRTLLLNKTNILHVTNWKKLIDRYSFEVKNAKILSFEKGVLKIIPTSRENVEIIVIEITSGELYFKTQYSVIK